MPRMDVVQMAEQILGPHRHVADRTTIHALHATPFVTGGRSQDELVFRNDADGGRTHAYMAPEESPDRTGLSPRTLSTARSKSVIVTVSRSSRIANMPASVQIAWMSAPVAPSQRDANTP